MAPKPSKRDWFRNKLVVRSPSPLPARPAPRPAAAATRTSSSEPTYTRNGSNILADALEALDREDRETIRTLLPTNVFTIDAAFDEVHGVVSELGELCANKRWSWTYKGHKVYVHDQVDKVVQLLDKFKSVGDVVANVDPIHVGLPWAGIRLILEVALSDRHQRAILVTGMELSFHISNRLKVYLDAYARASPSLASDNFRRSVVNLYAHILRFLGCAIRIQQKSAVSRTAQALWDTSDLTRFEERCDTLCSRAGEEARICDSGESLRIQLQSLQEIDKIHGSLSRLQDKADLAKLITAAGATYDSYAEGELPRCLPGTRIELLKLINDWATDPAGQRMFWLCGVAGTGKSTIARTVAESLHEDGLLGASFFFKRGRGDRSHATLLFPTIARQLADLFLEVGHAVASALDEDSLLCDKHLQPQFEKLLLQPLQQAGRPSIRTASVVIVIDALDECENDRNIMTILRLLSKIEVITSIRLRIFVTSRPELPVVLGFRKEVRGDLHHDVRLEDVEQTTIERDIRIFYELQFSQIKESNLQYDDEISAEWPGESTIASLVDRAKPLFIVAFTVSRYIAEADPIGRLDKMLRQDSNEPLTGLKDTYLPILEQVVAVGDASQRNIRTAEFQHIVGSIILLSNPLSTTALSSLLVISRPEIVKVLQPLSSVLNIPWTADGRIHPTTPITLFHLSFRDFLLDASLKDENKFWIDARKMHGILGTQCVRLLDYGTLREDICAVNNPGTRRAEVAKSTVHDSLPEAVAYACRYWVQHVVDSGEHVTDVGAVYPFLEKHLLHWMEALSWLGRASDIIHGLRALRSVTSAQSGTQLLSLLDDAIRLALSNRYIIDHAPLQTYVSALLFAPSQSIVRRMFAGGLRKYFKTMPRVPERWGAEMQKLEGHKRRLTSLAFSPDGKTLMSGSKDCAVIWDVATGEEMQKYEHETGVSDVAFSQDGNTLALYLGDSIVLRDTATGEVTQKLIGHHGEVTAAVFSLDSKTLSSTSKDSTIRLWDVATGKEMQKQELAQPIENESLVFSSDNRTIAYGSGECVLIQEAATGVEKQKLVGHTSVITAVAFLLDGRTVVSGSWDMTVRLWDIEIGKEKQKFIGHTQSVLCVAGSLDSRTIASGSVDRTVRLWDARTGIQKQSFTGHSDAIVAIAFSAGGKTIASGSWDMTVRLWDATMSEETQKLEGPEDSGPSLNNPITAMCVSLDGQMIVSGSWDGTIRLWDVATGEETQRPLVTNAQYIKAVDLSPDLEILAFGSMYGAFGLSDPQLGTTRLWDADTGEEIDEVSDAMRSRKGRDVGFIKISPHSKTILITTERDEMIDEAVRLWDVATEKEMQRFQLSSTEDIEEGILHEVLTAVAFSLDSTTVATGSAVQLVASGPWDGTVRLWDAASGKLTDIRCSKLHRYPRWMRFTNDGSALDTDVGRVDLSLPCGLGQASPPPITEVSMSSDYQWVQCDGSDVLWLPHGYRDHSRRAFASHGALIAVGREDGTVSCFSFEPWFGIT
ncbi:hypothetical protein LTR91_008727 [Friedmanniomyces endolithicus]|uniref:NACHT domain-containing protein n=1 Tax=Friedmanniomyces endolithicus TaxID=329885 RepID=A0AAN6QUP0_9PEZI|nr:hypothetical protein LTR75_007762 [Friedmanniomyces endolithicus]KAK0849365.1 hypothetical protein LTR03_005242 [Friedmanniomyces endolithicus]KAK0880442.1 hypothetical protein LTR87_005721 [Friedmanniomyces endolithicus]KAK0918873.1 hypothetical protein LTR57_011296 [Friedmanniomyces endolithicus]KAK0970926.1 hypothetical protein LTS01_015551 [Friedmanniomyces endolithicus]